MKELREFTKGITAAALAAVLLTARMPVTASAEETGEPQAPVEAETDGDTAIAETDGFSLYTVEFTYDSKQYVLPGDSEVALSEILEAVGLTGEVTEVSVSDASLFSAKKCKPAADGNTSEKDKDGNAIEDENGTWFVFAHQAFSTEEWMKVTIGGVAYEIVVTDDAGTGSAEGAKTITGLGTGAITNPVQPANYVNAWSGSYVYYGKYDGENPTKYRVLDKASDKFGVTGGSLFLDCDSTLYEAAFDNDGVANTDAQKPNEWTYSDVKSGLNGDSFLTKDGNFTDAEKCAIAESTVSGHALVVGSEAGQVTDWTQGAFVNYTPLTGEQIFLLDAEDASNIAYGYSTTNYHVTNREKTGSKPVWWLRSPYSSSVSMGGSVSQVGEVNGDSVFHSSGVSPAFNVNLSSVIFSSLISSESGIAAGSLGAEYKLTLKDGGLSIAAGAVTKDADNKVSIPYTITDNSSADPTQVSVVVVKDGTWTESGWSDDAQLLQYAKLEMGSFGTPGTGTFTLDSSKVSGTWGTDYHVYILAEDVNGEKETDYASAPVEIKAVTASATGYEGIYDGKPHGITVNVTSPESGTTVKYGDSADNCTSDTSLTITNASDIPKTVYYQVSANGYLTSTGSADIKINKAPLTVKAKNKTITYGDEPSDNGVEYSGFVNGETVSNLGGTLNNAYSYSQYGDIGDSYTITPSGLTSDNYGITFEAGKLTVTAKDVTVSGIKAKDKTYDGTAEAELDYESMTLAGVVNSDALSATATGAFENPHAGNGKTVNISGITLQGDKSGNYKLAASGQQTAATAAISKADIPMEQITAPAAKTGLSYTGSAQELITAGSVVGATGTMQYAFARVEGPANSPTAPTDESAYSTDIPKATNAGTYYVWYMVKGDSNHKDTAHQCIPVSVDRADISPVVTITDWTYLDAAHTPAVTEGNPGNGAVSFEYYTDAECNTKTTPENSGAAAEVAVPKNAGTWYVKALVAETDNYKAGTATARFTIAKRSLAGATITLTENDGNNEYGDPSDGILLYNGNNQTVSVTGVKLGDTVIPDSEYTVTVPPDAKNADTYQVSVKANENTNYTGEARTAFAILKGRLHFNDSELPITKNSIEYGKTLSDVCLNAANATIIGPDGKDAGTLSGHWHWVDGKTVPAVSDSGRTKYKVYFGPDNSHENGTDLNYVRVETELTVTVTKSTPAAPEGLFWTKSSAGTADGAIYGVDRTMEYSVDGRSTWKAVTGTAITGLRAGEVYIRFAETENTNAGREATITIGGTSPILTGVSISGINEYYYPEYGQTLRADLTPSDCGNVAFAWLRGGEEISGATGRSYTLTAEDIGKTIQVRAVQQSGTDTQVSCTSAATNAVQKAEVSTAPPVPELIEKTATSLTVRPVEGCKYGYCPDDNSNPEYQYVNDGVITGLNPDTKYKIVVRYKETEITQEGAFSDPLHVKTKSNNSGSSTTTTTITGHEKVGTQGGDLETTVTVEGGISGDKPPIKDADLTALTENLINQQDSQQSSVLTDAEKLAVEQGATLTLDMCVKKLEEGGSGTSAVPVEDKTVAVTAASETAKQIAGSSAQPGDACLFLDITLHKQIDGVDVGTVADTGENIKFTVTAPESMTQNIPANKTRWYFVLCIHNGNAVEVGRSNTPDVHVSSRLFSTYVLTYVDKENSSGGGSGGGGGGGSTPNVSVTGVTVSPKTAAITLSENKAVQFTATVEPENATDKTVTWSQSSEDGGEVALGSETSNSVMVTAAKAGTVTLTVTATDGGKTDTATITITEAELVQVTGVAVTPDKVELLKGETLKLNVEVTPEDASDTTVTWTSSDPDRVTVTEDGVIKAVAAGTATVTATAGGVTGSATVTVTEDRAKEKVIEETEEETKTQINEDLKGGSISDLIGTDPSDTGTVVTVDKDGNITDTKVWVGGIESEYKYTGKNISPEPHVYDGVKKLVKGTDYSISYSDNRTAGKASLTVSFKGNYRKDPQTVYYEIKPAKLGEDVIVTAAAQEAGRAVKPKLTYVMRATGTPIPAGRFTVNPAGKITISEAETKEVTVSAKDTVNFTGTADVVIEAASKTKLINKATVTINPKSYTYMGREIVPDKKAYTVKVGGTVLTYGVDYEISEVLNNVEPGKATVIIEGAGEYKGSKTANFTISKGFDLTNADDAVILVNGDKNASVKYAKGGVTPDVAVYLNDLKLVEGTDYTLKFSGNKAVGKSAEVKVTFKGKYKGTKTAVFEIVKQDLENLSVAAEDRIKSDKADFYKNPKITITDINGKKLGKNDYTVSTDYTYDETSGEVKVTLKGKGNYSEEEYELVYRVITKDQDIKKAAAAKIADKVYTGRAIELTESDLTGRLKLGGKTLTPGEDFEIDKASYRNNVAKGTASVVIRGKGLMGGVKTLKFKIVQKPVNWKGRS